MKIPCFSAGARILACLLLNLLGGTSGLPGLALAALSPSEAESRDSSCSQPVVPAPAFRYDVSVNASDARPGVDSASCTPMLMPRAAFRVQHEQRHATRGAAQLTKAEISALKNELFLKGLDVGTKGQPAALARAQEALSRFRQGTLEIPEGLTRQHLLDYRAAAVDAIGKAAGKPAGQLAGQVQGVRIQLIDEILGSGKL